MRLTADPILKERADLGEGAIWDAHEQVLHWVDIDRHLIHTFDPATGKDISVDVGDCVGTVVKRAGQRGGGFVVGLGTKIAHVDEHGQITVLADTGESNKNRLNDGKCDPGGRFWCGSMSFDFAACAGHLYMMDCEQRLHRKLDDVTISNGIVWSGDGKLMYYIDTPTGRLEVFDYDAETGSIMNRRLALENTWGGYFDGMTIDCDDNVYIAIWEGGKVLKINPRSGQLICTIAVPGVNNVTSCAFGGRDLQDLYITTSGKGADLKAQPNAGNLFRVRIEDTQGAPAREYRG